MVTSVYPDPSQMNYTVNMGDVVTFQCEATGIPAPSITWLRNGTELVGPRYTLSEPSQLSLTNGEMVFQTARNLTLTRTEDGDTGVYDCMASNGATPGEDTGSFELIVQSKKLSQVADQICVTCTVPRYSSSSHSCDQ